MHAIDVLNALPPTAEFERRLRAAAGTLLGDSAAATMLDRYKAARASLARAVAANAAAAQGLAIAAAQDELPPEQAAKVARSAQRRLRR
jgi:hypothetical protein